MPQVRLYLSNVRPDDPGYGLMGGADAGCAIDERNLAWISQTPSVYGAV